MSTQENATKFFSDLTSFDTQNVVVIFNILESERTMKFLPTFLLFVNCLTAGCWIQCPQPHVKHKMKLLQELVLGALFM